jgi:hypothetical protein
MAKYLKLEANKTYATEANAIKAVEKHISVYQGEGRDTDGLDFIMMQTPEGRWFPVFIGQRALDAGMHFRFNVLA